MATATNRARRAAGDIDSVFANDELLCQVLDDVAVDSSMRESPLMSPRAKPVVTQHRPANVLAEQIAFETRAGTRTSMERDADSRRGWHLWPTICIRLMLLGAVLLYQGLPASWRAAINPWADSPTTTANASSASQARENRLRTVSIEDVRVGDRIVGCNPIRGQAEVEAGNLRMGELVDTIYGPKHVISVTPLDHNGFVYNLETTAHVYRVGSIGTLVHNSCAKGIALGQDIPGGGYKALAERTGASPWRSWAADGVTQRTVYSNFGRAFHQAAQRARKCVSSPKRSRSKRM